MTLSLGGGGSTTTFDFVAKHALPAPRGFSGSIGIGPTLYVFGGPSALAPSTVRTNTVYAYDIPTDTWTVKSPMPAPLEYFAYAAIGTKIYAGPSRFPVGTGAPPSNALYEYDTVTGGWTTKAPLVTTDPINFPRMCAVGTKLYMFSYDDGFHTTAVYTWDQTTNIWGTDNNSGGIDGGQSPAPMWAGNVGGKVYVIGSPTQYMGYNRTFRFNPANHVWERLADPPFGVPTGIQLDGVGVVVDTMIYILTLLSLPGSIFITALYRYETLTNTWTTVISRPANRGIAELPPPTATGVNLGVGTNGKLYFSGGFTQALTPLSTVWEMTLPGSSVGEMVLGGLALG